MKKTVFNPWTWQEELSFDVFREFVAKHEMKQAVTLLQVVALNDTLNIELDATVVK